MFGWDARLHDGHRPDRFLPGFRPSWSRLVAALALTLALASAPALFPILPGLPPVRAQGVPGDPASPSDRPEPLSLTLDQAIQLALEQGPDRKAADLELELARLDHEEATANHLVQPSPVTLSQAESAWRSAQAEHAASSGTIALSVEEAYYDLIRSRQQVELSRGNLEQARRQLESAQTRYDAGALAELDLKQTRQQVDQAEAQLETDRRSLEQAQQELNRLLGRPLDAPLEPAEAELTFTPSELDLRAALASALEQRLEVIRAQDQVETARLNLELSRNPYTPRLDQERRQVELQQAQDGLEQARLQVELEVRKAFQTVEGAAAQVPLREQAAALAQEQLRIARLRFEAGTITSLDVTDAQQTAFEAQVAALNAVFDYRISLARFYQAAQWQGPGSGSVTD
ncbi:TolC family protein [Limnochorda pilosa]|uniref:Transporter n=1 Tax=Limnochorda pilosa TaxID=1555112 RepID=A0A0K2SPH8_LIMPI|nr:TolC family protein [Limnochorda pilosa]BAS28714.1 hypothetical protein LIP_2885 [Limnochorda pilosa]